jgi:ent-copalyl diphosphate synthase
LLFFFAFFFLLSLDHQSGPSRISIHGKAGAGAGGGGAGATGPRGNLRLGGLAGWWRRQQQHPQAPSPAPATTTQQSDNVSSAKGINLIYSCMVI